VELEDFQKAFTPHESLIHLNNGGLAPSSRAALSTVEYWMKRFHLEGVHCNDDYMAAAEVARAHLAHLAGAQPGEVAFFQSTAGAISQIAFGLGLKPEDEILLWDQEYGSNLYPRQEACARSGAKLIFVPREHDLYTQTEKFLAHVTPRTKVLAFSWVQFQTGAVTDIAAVTSLARARGIWSVADIIQGFGALPFDFHKSGLDAACGGSHKWLVSPVGVGFLIVREDRVRELKPLTIGASTYGTCDDKVNLTCEPKKNALRFESGSKQVLEITAVGASAQLLTSVGVATLADRIATLAQILRNGLTRQGYTLHAPREAAPAFVNFSARTDADLKLCAELLRTAGVSFAWRGPGLRLTPHAFNSENDIERVLKTLARKP
jgi:selenocysteine lyase/cysteine desulfurase